MKQLILLLLIWPFCLSAEEKNPSLLEKMTQPKITLQSDYLSDANFEGFDASVQTYKQKIQVNNEMFGVSYSRWDFDWGNADSLPFYKGKTP